MLIVHETMLRHLISAVVASAHSLRDHNGDLPTLGTMSEQQLRTAAITALSIATGQTIDTVVPVFKKVG